MEEEAAVLMSPQLRGQHSGSGGINRRGQAQVKLCVLQWTATAIFSSKKVNHHSPAAIPSYNAIFLATLCLLNMRLMLYLPLSSPSREQLALT